ncbi:MAG: ARMT1-like domain-containing protein, partial [Desulfobulbaceae bacterium]|nr:ARMT1-like domain-containing protein [Desulfobulbaceae bacterium]
SILYLADNCGEIVFDSLLIEQLGPQKITLAVKERPIINDALITDTASCGLNNLCTVISNGTDCPGTPLAQCSEEFQDCFHNADLIISKGQGNFETLSESNAPLYFLLTVKCPVVVDHVNMLAGKSTRVSMGEMILLKPAANFTEASQ